MPLYGSVEDESGVRSAILKFAASENRISEGLLLNEFVATKLAAGSGIAVPPVIWARLDPMPRAMAAAIGVTSNSNSVLVVEKLPLDPLIDPLADDEDFCLTAIDLTYFDFLTMNADRIYENPNCGLLFGSLFAFDFGAALPSPGANPASFDRSFAPPSDRERYESHLFCPHPALANGAVPRFTAQNLRQTLEQLGPLMGEFDGELAQQANLITEFVAFLSENFDMLVNRYRSFIE